MPDSMPTVAGSGLILSKEQRKDAGIGDYYVDAYNEAQLAQYNNDYQYALWKEQMDYNSPVKQVERLKEAGLNPNFNSIDGTGNVDMTAKNQTIKSNIAQTKYQSIDTAISGFNSILGAIKEGVDLTSEISGIPNNISGYRQLINQGKFYEVADKRLKSEFQRMMGALEQYKLFGPNNTDNVRAFPELPEDSVYRVLADQSANQTDLKTALMELQKEWDSWSNDKKIQYLNDYFDHNRRMWVPEEHLGILKDEYQSMVNRWFNADQTVSIISSILGAALQGKRLF